jgi:hypothetical protein
MGVESILAPFMQQADLCITVIALDFRSYELAEPGTGIRARPLLTALPDAAAPLRQIPACWRSRPPRRAGMHAVPACLIRRRARHAALGWVAVPVIMSWSAEYVWPAF